MLGPTLMKGVFECIVFLGQPCKCNFSFDPVKYSGPVVRMEPAVGIFVDIAQNCQVYGVIGTSDLALLAVVLFRIIEAIPQAE